MLLPRELLLNGVRKETATQEREERHRVKRTAGRVRGEDERTKSAGGRKAQGREVARGGGARARDAAKSCPELGRARWLGFRVQHDGRACGGLAQAGSLAGLSKLKKQN